MTDANRPIYERVYADEHLEADRPRTPYDEAIVRLRLDYLARLGAGRDVADLGCGTGAYLLPVAAVARRALGVDYAETALRTCRARARSSGLSTVRLTLADIRALPLPDASFDLVFSIGTLYAVPDAGRALAEMGRVLRPGGRAFFELGNLWSLNTLVVREHPPAGLATYHLTLPEMRRSIARSGLAVVEHRTFQLLPMYGGPRYLRPLVTAHWKRVMGLRLGGVLLDERVSSLGPLRWLAFRHVFVCAKGDGRDATPPTR